MALLQITKDNYEQITKNADKPVLIDLWAQWCMPCKMLMPIIEQVATEKEGNLIVGKVNVDESPEIATELGVMNIPTLVFFKNGQECGRSSGMITQEGLQEKLVEYCGV